MIVIPGWYLVWLPGSHVDHHVYISPSGSFHSLDGEVTHFEFYDALLRNGAGRYIRDIEWATNETTD